MILYIGNKLSKHGYTPTSVETLGPLLSQFYDVETISDKKNKFIRIADMAWQTIKHRKTAQLLLVDTYSTSNFYYAVVIALLCKLLHKPYINILRGGDLPNRLKSSPKLSHFVFSNAKYLVAPSNYLLRAFTDAGYQNAILISNNIPIAKYQYIRRGTYQPYILWVRSLHATYNPELAIQILAALKTNYPDAKLCMVGQDKDGSLDKCKALAKTLQVDNAVEFKGYLSKNEWHALSKEYSIFLNTTNFDNMPISVIEAMALGLPVVTTNVGGIPFLFTHNQHALLVEPNNLNEMLAAITLLLSQHAEADRLANNARKLVEQFDWEVVKQQWFNILDAYTERLPS